MIRKLCQSSFSQLMGLQRGRYFSKELEERSGKGEFEVAAGIRCFDYSKSSAVFEGIADDITLAWSQVILGDDNDEGESASKSVGERVRDLVWYAAALEPGGERLSVIRNASSASRRPFLTKCCLSCDSLERRFPRCVKKGLSK